MIFGVRAKTIKNQVTPNAQLTAEEWRRLYERESDRTKQLFSALTGLDGEVKRWRGGELIKCYLKLGIIFISFIAFSRLLNALTPLGNHGDNRTEKILIRITSASGR